MVAKMDLTKFPIRGFNTAPTPPKEDDLSHPEPVGPNGNKRLADEHIANGHTHAAITRYKKAVHMSNNDPLHRTELGDAYAFAELSSKAVEQYKRAIKKDPKSAEPYFGMAEICVRYGRWQLAMAHFEKAVGLSPKNAFYKYKYANAAVQAGSISVAIEQLEAAVELLPDDPFYHFELASLYADAHRNQDAVREMESAVRLSPADDYYAARLGMLYVRVGNLEQAADMYRAALDISPAKHAYHHLLADTYYSLGFESRAEHQYKEGAHLDDYESDFLNRARKYSLGGAW